MGAAGAPAIRMMVKHTDWTELEGLQPDGEMHRMGSDAIIASANEMTNVVIDFCRSARRMEFIYQVHLRSSR